MQSGRINGMIMLKNMKKKDTKRTSVFISYSHADSEWLARLRVHLRPLERDLAIEIWDDTRIASGSKWRSEIKKALESAKVAILLISADFLASDFIHANELPPLLSAAEKDGALILPVIVSPSRFLRTEGLRDFQSVNPPSNPLAKMGRAQQEDVFVELTEHIETAMAPRATPAPATEASEAQRSAARAILNRIPLIVYYETVGEERAQDIYADLQAAGMRPRAFGRELGYTGARTVGYSPEYRNAAEWLSREYDEVQGFETVPISERDDYRGIVINLW